MLKKKSKIVIFVCFLFFAITVSCEKKGMTSEEFYYYLLARRDSSAEYKEGEQSELTESVKSRYRALSQPLQYLLLDVVKKGNHLQYKAPSRDVFVGGFSLDRGRPARTRRSPNNGILILVNPDFVTGLYEWAKIVVHIYEHHWGFSPELSTDASMEELRQQFDKSVQDYLRSGIVPNFPQYATNEKQARFATAIALGAVEFVLAHEYAHAIRGDLNASFDSDSDPVPISEYLKRESLVDVVAADILVRSPFEQNALINRDTRLASIYYCLTMFMLLDLFEYEGSPDEFGARSFQFKARIMTMQAFIVERMLSKHVLTNSDLKFTNSLLPALNRLIKTATAPRPNPADLKGDQRRRRDFWVAFKAGNEEKMRDLLSRNPQWFAKWANDLIPFAAEHADGLFESVAGDWTDGDHLGAADLFILAAKIDQLHREVTRKAAVDNVAESGRRIVETLLSTANKLKIGLSFRQSLQEQARRIEQHLEGRD